MEISTILSADILDIIFEGRNKEYGAYELRSNYRKRLTVSIAVMLMLIGLLLLGYFLAGKPVMKQARLFEIPETTLENIQPQEEVVPPPPPPQKPPPQQLETRQFTSQIRIVDEVKPEERPPEVSELENTRIGTLNQEGLKDDGVVAPPAEDVGRGVIEAPKQKEEEDWNKVFTKVEIESQYPGGYSAWKRFLERNLRTPQEALDNNVQGTVVVKFVVDVNGLVSNVEAISGPEELRPEAIRVIKKSGKWTPAVQNGRQVPSYKNQPIIFMIASE